MKGSSIKRGVGLCAALLALTAAVAATLGNLPSGLQLLAGHGPRPSSTVGTDKPAPSAQLSAAPPASYVPVGSPILTAYRHREPGITADNRALNAAGDPDGLVVAGAFPMAAPPATTASGGGAAPDASIQSATRQPIPGTIHLGAYNPGGQGVGYFDTTNDDVDLTNRNIGGWMETLVQIDATEWLNYDVAIQSAGRYRVRLRGFGEQGGTTLDAEVLGNAESYSRLRVEQNPMSQPNLAGEIILPAGNHVLRVTSPFGTVVTSQLELTYLGPASQTPWFTTPHAVPAPAGSTPQAIEAEHYDRGGHLVANLDFTPGNSGGAVRTDDVDVFNCTSGCIGAHIGNVEPGEWVEYTIQPRTPGAHWLTLRAAAALSSDNRIDLWLNGQAIAVDGVTPNGAIRVPFTGSWTNYVDTHALAAYLDLPEGPSIIRVGFRTHAVLLDSLRISRVQNPWEPSTGTINGAIPPRLSRTEAVRINAEDYDVGGALDLDGLTSTVYRPGEAVDIRQCASLSECDRLANRRQLAPNESGYAVTLIQPGERLGYTITTLGTSGQPSAAGYYYLQARVRSGTNGIVGKPAIRATRSGRPLVGTMRLESPTNSSGWQTVGLGYADLTAGEHQISLHFEGGGYELDWIEFVPVPATFSPGPQEIPGRIEAESYDGAVDLTSGNSAGAYRTGANDHADIGFCGDTGCGNAWTQIQTGEYLDFIVDVRRTAIYRMTLRVAAGATADLRSSFELLAPPTIGTSTAPPKIADIAIVNTGGQDRFANVHRMVKLQQGLQRLRLHASGIAPGHRIAVNWIEFEERLSRHEASIQVLSPTPINVLDGRTTTTLEATHQLVRLDQSAYSSTIADAQTQFYLGTQPLGAPRAGATAALDTSLAAGRHTVRARVTGTIPGTPPLAVEAWSEPVTVCVSGISPDRSGVLPACGDATPSIPGTIEVEHYDRVADGASAAGRTFSDSTANDSGYRVGDGVDIALCDDFGCGHAIVGTAAGEWTQYSVNVEHNSRYQIVARVLPAATPTSLRVVVDSGSGADVQTVIAIPAVTRSPHWMDVQGELPPIAAGRRTMRLHIVTGGFAINHLRFEPMQTASQGVVPTTVFNVIQPEGGVLAGVTTQVAAGAIGGESVRQFALRVGPDTLGTDATMPYAWDWTPPTAGEFQLRAIATTQSGLTTSTPVSRVVVRPTLPARRPYTRLHPWTAPGRIEAENYDIGGPGVAYHDTTTGNQDGVYRYDDVDIGACAGAGCSAVTSFDEGEWLKYTFETRMPGRYAFRLRRNNDPNYAWPGRIEISVDGRNIYTSMETPSVVSMDHGFAERTTAPFELPVGRHTLTLRAWGSQGVGLGKRAVDWIEIERVNLAPVAEIIEPAPTTQVYAVGSTLPVIASSIDPEGQSTSVTFAQDRHVGHSVVATALGTDTSSPFQVQSAALARGFVPTPPSTLPPSPDAGGSTVFSATPRDSDPFDPKSGDAAQRVIAVGPVAGSQSPHAGNTGVISEAANYWIRAEHFDVGPQSIAWNDATPDCNGSLDCGRGFTGFNSATAQRGPDVLPTSCGVTPNCSSYVGSTVSGEWIEYTVRPNPNQNSAERVFEYTADVTIRARSQSFDERRLRVELVREDNTVAVLTTDDLLISRPFGPGVEWQDHVIPNVVFPNTTRGNVIRVLFVDGGIELHSIGILGRAKSGTTLPQLELRTDLNAVRTVNQPIPFTAVLFNVDAGNLSGVAVTLRRRNGGGFENIATDTSPPFEFSWTPTAAGTEVIDAVTTPIGNNIGILTAEALTLTVHPEGSGGLPGGNFTPPVPPQFVTPQAADLAHEQVGATAGSFRVTESGTASYTIPLSLPPGINGFAPKLELSYDSSRGDGPLGVGWALGGLRSITRCRGATETGDQHHFVEYTPATPPGSPPIQTRSVVAPPLRFLRGAEEMDQYCLDGQRLILVSGTHGAPGATYRTEIESWQEVVVAGNGVPAPPTSELSIGGAASFRVIAKDGTVAWFGVPQVPGPGGSADTGAQLIVNSANPVDPATTGPYLSVPAGGNDARRAVMTWTLARHVDRSGNFIDYRYLNTGPRGANAGEQLIDEIRYGANESEAGQSRFHRARVKFVYEQVGWSYSYSSGMQMALGRRLEAIEIYNSVAGGAETLVRRYQLTYNNQQAPIPTRVDGQRSRITSIQECAGANGPCWPATRFDWAGAELGVSANNTPPRVISDGNVFRDAPDTSLRSLRDADAVKFGDVNGDGLTDMVWVKDHALCWSVARPQLRMVTHCDTGDNEHPNDGALELLKLDGGPEGWLDVAPAGAYHVLDMNGDGRDDIVVALWGDLTWRVLTADATVGEIDQQNVHTLFSRADGRSASLGISIGLGSMQLGDFDGDGLVDAMTLSYARGGGLTPPGGGWVDPFVIQGTTTLATLPFLLIEDVEDGNSRRLTQRTADNTSANMLEIHYQRDARSGVCANQSGRATLSRCFAEQATPSFHGIQGCPNGGWQGTEIPAGFLPGSSMTGMDIADFDGDGANDLRMKVKYPQGPQHGNCPNLGSRWLILKGVPSKDPTTGARWQRFHSIGSFPIGPGDAAIPTHEADADARFQTGDINGDGLTDLLYARNGVVNGQPRIDYVYRLNLGRLTSNYESYSQISNSVEGLRVGPEIFITDLGLALETSDRMFRTIQLADHDGDGDADLVYGRPTTGPQGAFVQYEIRRWGRTQNGFGAPVPLQGAVSSIKGSGVQHSERSYFVDIDGDARPEQVLVDIELGSDQCPGDGTNLALCDDEIVIRRAPQGSRYRPVDVITTITSGTGARTEVTYAPMSQGNIYRPGIGTHALNLGRGSPVSDLRMASYVVRMVASSAPTADNPGAMARIAYRYRGARLQGGGRGWLGFETVESLDVQNRIASATEYNQSFPLIGTPLSTTSVALPALADLSLATGGSWVATGAPGATLADRLIACVGSDDLSTAPLPAGCYSSVNSTAATRRWPESASSVLLNESTNIYRFVARGGSEYPTPIATTGPITSLPSQPRPVFVFATAANTRSYAPNETASDLLHSETVAYGGYDAFGNLLSSTSTRRIGEAGPVVKQVNTEHTYRNPQDLAGTEWSRFGRIATTSVTTSLPGQTLPATTRTTEFHYEPTTLRLLAEVIRPGGAAANPSDWVITAYRYDAFGNRIGTATCNGDVATPQEVQHCLNTVPGNLRFNDAAVDVVDPYRVRRLTAISFSHDGQGSGPAFDPRWPVLDQAALANAQGVGEWVTTRRVVQRHPSFGLATETADISGARQRTVYDAFGRSVATASNDGAIASTQLRWCSGAAPDGFTPGAAVPCPDGIHAVWRTRSTSNTGPTSWVYVDRLGREVLSVTQGYGTNQFVAVRTRYDAQGRTIAKSIPRFVTGSIDAAGNETAAFSLPAPGRESVTEHDRFGRVVQVAAPDPLAICDSTTSNTCGTTHSVTTIVHNGLITTTTPPANQDRLINTRTERRNVLDQVVEVIDAQNLRTCYRYWPTGEVHQTWRPQNGASCDAAPAANDVLTTVTYDARGRKTAMTDADKGTWSWRYNAIGDMIEETTARGHCIRHRYDDAGRLVRRDDVLGACSSDTLEQRAEWRYDYAVGDFGADAISAPGRLIVSRVLAGSTPSAAPSVVLERRSWVYDNLGRASRQRTLLRDQATATSPARLYEEQSTWDALGRPFQQFFTSYRDHTDAALAFPTHGVLHQYTTGADGYAPGYLRRIRDADGFESGPIYTDILERDPWGNVTREQRGRNGTGAAVEISRGYDADTGRLTGLGANRVGGGPLQSWTYRWDRVGNLHDRIDGLGASGSLREVFVYDPLNRLLRTHTGSLSTPASLTLSYLPNGNIGTRMVDNNWATSVGYAYGLPMSQPSPVCTSNVPGSVSPGPHAATSVAGQAGTTRYCYDASGNQLAAITDASNQRTLTYSVADHAREIRTRVAGIGERTEFEHGSARERIVRRDYASENATTPVAITHYVGGAEVIRRFRNNCSAVNSALTIRREIAGVVVLHELPLAATGCESAPPRLVRQLRLTDHLGSTDALLAFDGTAVSGAAGRQSFDAFGLRRNGSTWAALDVQARRNFDTSITRRGYTGHEQLDGAGLVHMNGRLYDPVLSRFIQADPIIQSPFDGQSLNRYTYVWNNPLAHTDPSGYTAQPRWLRAVTTITAIAITTYVMGNPAAALGLAKGATVTTSQMFYLAVTSASVAGGITGGPKGVLPGAIKGAAFFGAGQLGANTSILGQAVIHGVTGGILDELQGGNFGHGFINAGVNKFLNTTLATDNIAVDAVVTALIGGSLAEVTGGDFANGALTAAMQYAFNGLVTAIGGVVSETVDAASGGEFDGAMVAGAFKDGYDGEGKGVFWTVVEDGLTVIPFSKAGQGVVAATKGLVNAARGARASTPIGQWSTVAESMTARAASYQARISGRGGEAFVVNGVKFDGVRNGVLLDAKGPGYARFVRDGEFRPWWRGAEALVSQARRQLAAARGAPIQWHFAEESAASATRALLQGRGISGIDIVVTP